jgi:putative mRNA 3-end processing factor
MNHEVGFPMHVPPKDLKGIILTHAHLDHSGLTPLFYIQGRIPIYGVEPTFQLTDLLIKDFIHLSGYFLPYEFIDLQTMLSHTVNVGHRQQFTIGDSQATLLNAGHIPGSSQVLLENHGKRLLYTGDFNDSNTRLLNGADQDYNNLDALIIESTYANEDHQNRAKVEEELVRRVTEVVRDGGVVLVPAFGVGRSQEIISILAAHHFEYPIFVDGMALDAIQIFMNNLESLADPELFKRAVRNADWMEKWNDRRRAVRTPSVIVSPAGMLKGGAAMFYMESVAKRRENAVFLVSYQIPGTPGSILLEKKRFMFHGKASKVEAQVEQFDFSSHVGKSELERRLSKLDKKTKVFTMHGAEKNCTKLASWASREMGLEAVSPKTGETYDI